MPLVISVCAKTSGIAGMTLPQTNDNCAKTDSTPITCTVRQRQFRLYGHVAHYSKIDPAYQVVAVKKQPRMEEAEGMSTELMV